MQLEQEWRIEVEGEHKYLIECAHVQKTFDTPNGPAMVVEDLKLQVREKEFVVLFGPGQCGKTTIINLLAGLETPTHGTVTVGGELVEEPGPERGVVYQTISLFPWLTAMENVEFGPKYRGMPKAQRRKLAQYYIDLVGLQGFEDAYPVKLSGGMKQRVGIARAYANDPVVILMDEPFGALDAQTRYLMQKELEQMWEKETKTVVFVTNNIEEALYLADRIVLLKGCPTGVKREYVIDMPRPRDYVHPDFLRLRKEITSHMDKTR